MQPYFLPYIGYWQLLSHVDTFVVYDNIQYSKQGWFNKNNILLNNQKTQFTLPLKKESDYLNVVNRHLADDAEAKINKILRQIENQYKKAPNFDETINTIRNCFLYPEKNLFHFIFNSIKTIKDQLAINTQVLISSTINMDHSLKGEEKVIEICRHLNATHYINPIGGVNLYHAKNFSDNGITLSFLNSALPRYQQFTDAFVPYLSIIDALLFTGFNEVKNSLSQYQLIET